MLAKAEVRGVVLEELHALLEEDSDDDEVPELTGEEALNELKLNSLALARLIIQLEAAVGVDPFADGDLSIVDIQLVADLVAAYEDAVEAEANAA